MGTAKTLFKVGLYLVGCCVLMVVVLGLGGWWLWRSKGTQIEAWAERTKAEGAEFGHARGERACLDEVIARRRRGDPGMGLRDRFWFSACLEAAQPLDGFCDGVPDDDDFLKSTTWSAARCLPLGFDGPDCTTVFGELSEHCHSAARQAKVSAR